jgi:hypothetical protein
MDTFVLSPNFSIHTFVGHHYQSGGGGCWLDSKERFKGSLLQTMNGFWVPLLVRVYLAVLAGFQYKTYCRSTEGVTTRCARKGPGHQDRNGDILHGT